ncbi:MAG: DEAD/DEAH box helicase [Vicinamibacterales bacterium]
MSFSALNLHPNLLLAIKELGFARPTPIQAEAIPPAMAGRDVLASAQTGSGKTAAFLLPILHALIERPRGTTRALVLVPTRELAAQVREDMRDLAVHTPVTGSAVYGGVNPGPQEHAFRSGVDILIATPGRLLDHMRHQYAKLPRLDYLVLDEADRMLDMGFLPEIRKILRQLPAKRQTLFFSATLPTEIRALMGEMLKDPVNVHREKTTTTPSGITQAVYPVSQDLKASLLIALLTRGDIKQALVFTRTKHRANRLADTLVRAGINANKIHGNRSQAQRVQALKDFKAGACPVLVATDIVARGIDVEDLGHVVNFDVPLVPEDYIHRVGRTGRAEATGEAFTLAAPEERASLTAIERALGRPLSRVTVPDFDYNARPAARLEVPLQQRIAEIRARKADDRARAEAKRARWRRRTVAHRGWRCGRTARRRIQSWGWWIRRRRIAPRAGAARAAGQDRRPSRRISQWSARRRQPRRHTEAARRRRGASAWHSRRRTAAELTTRWRGCGAWRKFPPTPASRQLTRMYLSFPRSPLPGGLSPQVVLHCKFVSRMPRPRVEGACASHGHGRERVLPSTHCVNQAGIGPRGAARPAADTPMSERTA